MPCSLATLVGKLANDKNNRQRTVQKILSTRMTDAVLSTLQTFECVVFTINLCSRFTHMEILRQRGIK